MSSTQRQKKLYEEICIQLQALVHKGNLQPGDRLPPERQLAATFKVSRNCVREAIKSLEQIGLLSSRPGAGTYISASAQTSLTEAMGELFAQERHRVADIFELRLLLEPQIAHLAASRIDETELSTLQDLLEQYEEALGRNQPIAALDQNFHDAIAASTGNQAITRLMEHMQDMLSESRDEILQSPERNHMALQGHRAIVAALRKKDPQQAQAAMAEHLAQTQKIIFTSSHGEEHERNS